MEQTPTIKLTEEQIEKDLCEYLSLNIDQLSDRLESEGQSLASEVVRNIVEIINFDLDNQETRVWKFQAFQGGFDDIEKLIEKNKLPSTAPWYPELLRKVKALQELSENL
jgi:hypothetical protein